MSFRRNLIKKRPLKLVYESSYSKSFSSLRYDQNKIVAQIQKGLLVLVGIEDADTQEDINWLTSKIGNLRIFEDENEVMNLSLKDIAGEIIVVSQFTLQASTKKETAPVT